MGVADNKSYKDMYHFRNEYYNFNKDELPSLKGEPAINTSIKDNPYRSNVEIEEGEIVLQPDLSALFKARGKKHSGGGIDVNLKPDSFIFSDDKTLAFTERDHEVFEFKEGGTFSKTKNTPAEVLKRNIDIKHYNTLVNNLNDLNKDDLTKKTSVMMLEKYIQTLGNVAYLQEAKKDFPDGIPPFSVGTAPIYDSNLKEDIMEQKQYAKYGGRIQSHYQSGGRLLGNRIGSFIKEQEDEYRRAARRNRAASNKPVATAPSVDEWGLWEGDKGNIFMSQFGVNNAADKIANLDLLAQELGYTGPKNNRDFQKWLYSSSPENKAVIDKWHSTYGEPNIGRPEGERNRFDGKIGIRWQNAINEIRRPRTPMEPIRPEGPTGSLNRLFGNPPNVPDADIPPSPDTVTGDPQQGITADWEFTPWQKVSQLYNLGKYASAKRYMPYRSRFNPSFVDPALVNPEQAVGDLRSSAAQQTNSLNTLNPILRNAQASSIYGQLLDKAPAVRSQYDNENVGITNQFRQMNNQIVNNARSVNMQNDQQYYQQQVVGRQNFDNMKTFLADQYMNNLLRDVETNQSLAYRMLTVNNPAYGYDFKSGNFYRNKMDIRDVNNSAQGDYIGSLLQNIDFNNLSNTEKIQFVRELQRGKALQYLNPGFGQTPPPFKKGGRNPYRR